MPKTKKPKGPTISLGEFANLANVKETIIAGFKVWLKFDIHSRTREEWQKLLEKYMKS